MLTKIDLELGRFWRVSGNICCHGTALKSLVLDLTVETLLNQCYYSCIISSRWPRPSLGDYGMPSVHACNACMCAFVTFLNQAVYLIHL